MKTWPFLIFQCGCFIWQATFNCVRNRTSTSISIPIIYTFIQRIISRDVFQRGTLKTPVQSLKNVQEHIPKPSKKKKREARNAQVYFTELNHSVTQKKKKEKKKAFHLLEKNGNVTRWRVGASSCLADFKKFESINLRCGIWAISPRQVVTIITSVALNKETKVWPLDTGRTGLPSCSSRELWKVKATTAHSAESHRPLRFLYTGVNLGVEWRCCHICIYIYLYLSLGMVLCVGGSEWVWKCVSSLLRTTLLAFPIAPFSTAIDATQRNTSHTARLSRSRGKTKNKNKKIKLS